MKKGSEARKHKNTKVKLTVQWVPQEVREAKNMEHLRKVYGNDHSHSKREVCELQFVIWAVLPKPFGVQT